MQKNKKIFCKKIREILIYKIRIKLIIYKITKKGKICKKINKLYNKIRLILADLPLLDASNKMEVK